NRMVSKVNALEPDLVVFTGDLVNNFASELVGWKPILDKIKGKDGVYAILGNHDYGDYVKWRTPKDKEQNFAEIVSFFDKVGWKLMRNERKMLVKNSDTLMLAGVENWGHPPFPQYGDLNMSVPLTTKHPVLLLSHDPSHWESEIIDHQANIFLTLSGHTHGFQFGIRSSWLNLSPVSMKYEKWGGLYEQENRLLYINVGAGTIGFPGRIGMRPEITLLTLHSKN
ncbi:MAG: metallophosphoesterase, partial [Salinivirgaceae bacterium]